MSMYNSYCSSIVRDMRNYLGMHNYSNIYGIPFISNNRYPCGDLTEVSPIL